MVPIGLLQEKICLSLGWRIVTCYRSATVTGFHGLPLLAWIVKIKLLKNLESESLNGIPLSMLLSPTGADIPVRQIEHLVHPTIGPKGRQLLSPGRSEAQAWVGRRIGRGLKGRHPHLVTKLSAW
jgi:hypothetical protein